MSLSSAALRRPVTTVAATLALVLLGAVSLGRLPVSLLPDVTLPVLTIRTDYPGAAATEASRFVAEPIEEAIAATPGLVELRSVSRNGEVTTTARFAWGTDMATTVLTVRERLDNARAQLPETAERPTLLTSDPGQRPIAVLGLTSSRDLRALSLLAAAGARPPAGAARRHRQRGGVGRPRGRDPGRAGSGSTARPGPHARRCCAGHQARQRERAGRHHPPGSVPLLGSDPDRIPRPLRYRRRAHRKRANPGAPSRRGSRVLRIGRPSHPHPARRKAGDRAGGVQGRRSQHRRGHRCHGSEPSRSSGTEFPDVSSRSSRRRLGS